MTLQICISRAIRASALNPFRSVSLLSLLLVLNSVSVDFTPAPDLRQSWKASVASYSGLRSRCHFEATVIGEGAILMFLLIAIVLHTVGSTRARPSASNQSSM